MSKQMQKKLKQVTSILAALVFMVISAYASKKTKQDKQQKAPAVKVQQESQETVLPIAEPTVQTEQNASKKKTVRQATESKAPAVTEKQTAPTPAPALPSAQTTKDTAVKQKAQTTPEVSTHRPAPEENTGGWTTIPPPDFKPKSKWHRSNLERHWEKHQAEFPEFHNEQEYGVAALYFFEHPPKGTLTKTNGDGDRMFYHQDSNTFGVLTSDGTAKTMFRPSAGINYWRRQ